MMGVLSNSEEEGLIPRLSRDLIAQSSSKINTHDPLTNDLITDMSLLVSFFEIYNERVYDLLSTTPTSGDVITPCRVREHPETGAFIEGLTHRPISSYAEVLRALSEGLEKRITGETLMNATSSRSHAVFTLQLTQTRRGGGVKQKSSLTLSPPPLPLHRLPFSPPLSTTTPTRTRATSTPRPSPTTRTSPRDSPRPSPVSSPPTSPSMTSPSSSSFASLSRQSKICLVDLAGSERLEDTRSTGMRLKEGTMINLSLSTLGDVIKALSQRGGGGSTTGGPGGGLKHVPYRNSTLTWVMKDCLGGNSRTTILATISPHAVHYAESLNTIRFITKAKFIVNKVRVNERKTGTDGVDPVKVMEMARRLDVFERRIFQLEDILQRNGLASEIPDEEVPLLGSLPLATAGSEGERTPRDEDDGSLGTVDQELLLTPSPSVDDEQEMSESVIRDDYIVQVSC
jgi:hypothetical protein